jgi:sugar lactone lactonase YvrE
VTAPGGNRFAGCFACVPGGEGGRTLFVLTAGRRGTEEVLQARTGELVAAPAPVPGAGRR